MKPKPLEWILHLPDNACRQAARKVFKGDEILMREALAVTRFENGSGDPRTRRQNTDRRRTWDLGCFQINHYWQRHRIAKFGDPLDPIINAKIAYDIATTDGNWHAWYAVCTKGQERFPLERCGR